MLCVASPCYWILISGQTQSVGPSNSTCGAEDRPDRPDRRFRIQFKSNKNEHAVSIDSAYKRVFGSGRSTGHDHRCMFILLTPKSQVTDFEFWWTLVFLLVIFVHEVYQACSAYISGVTSSLSANSTEITCGHSEVKSTYPLHSSLRAAPQL